LKLIGKTSPSNLVGVIYFIKFCVSFINFLKITKFCAQYNLPLRLIKDQEKDQEIAVVHLNDKTIPYRVEETTNPAHHLTAAGSPCHLAIEKVAPRSRIAEAAVTC
jgi:hypothetical protein